MNKAEFISYKPTPNDPYTKGFASLRVNVPMIVTYKRVSKKDGGEFFADPQVQYINDSSGAKSYQHAFQTDSRADEDLIKSICDQGYESWKAQHSVQKPSSMSEVAQDDGLPFWDNSANPDTERS